MKPVRLAIVVLLFASLGLLFYYVFFSHPAHSAVAEAVAQHIVISEIQISGDGGNPADDEFVELYNPTNSEVVMSSWRLTRKNSSGTEDNLVATLNGTVPAHGYFLITDGVGYNGAIAADVNYSAPSNALTNNYTVLLYSDAGTTLVDKVGFGTAADFETSAFASNPAANGSIERKANSASTDVSMASGGSDETAGNGEDTDNNANDFVAQTTSNPQNSASSVEISPTPTATPTPSETPIATPTETPIESPTLTPTESPTPSETPTSTPTESPTPTPTESVTPTPTETSTPTPTESPTPTATPTVAPSVTPTPTSLPTPTPTPSGNPTIHLPGLFFSCTIQYVPIKVAGLNFRFPRISCARNV